MPREAVRVAVEDGIATLTFCNTARLNALSFDAFRLLGDLFLDLGQREDVQAIILTGEGRAFCAGLSLDTVLRPDGTSASPAEVDEAFVTAVNRLMSVMLSCPKPLVSAVNGVVAGGGLGIALTADLVLAASDAEFHCAFVPMLALIPDCGASWLLPNLIGRNRALAHALLGEKIDAQQALQWGLLYELTEPGALASRARELAARLAHGPREAILRTRSAFTEASQIGFEAMLEKERQANVFLLAQAEAAEGLRAFLDKRPPDFLSLRRCGDD